MAKKIAKYRLPDGAKKRDAASQNYGHGADDHLVNKILRER
jgi:hypothetical protein